MSTAFKVTDHLIDDQQWPDVRAVSDTDGKLIGYDVQLAPLIPPERLHMQVRPGGIGFTIETLLAIALHRLRYLNSEVKSAWNDAAIDKVKRALEDLHDRTRDRKQRGVEGTTSA